MFVADSEEVGSKDPETIPTTDDPDPTNPAAVADDRDKDDPEFVVDEDFSCVGMEFSSSDPAGEDVL